MSDPRCPACKNPILSVQPVRLEVRPDSRREADLIAATRVIGFKCETCDTLLPLVPDAAAS